MLAARLQTFFQRKDREGPIQGREENASACFAISALKKILSAGPFCGLWMAGFGDPALQIMGSEKGDRARRRAKI